MNTGTMQELIKLSAFIFKWRVEQRETEQKLGINMSVTVVDKSGTNRWRCGEMWRKRANKVPAAYRSSEINARSSMP